MKRLLISLTLLAFLVAAGAATAFVGLRHWGMQSKMRPEAVEVTLEPGESLQSFSRELAAAGVVEHPLLFQFWTRLFSRYQNFQAGRYRVPAAYRIDHLVADIISGRTFNPVVLQFTIPEGFTVKKVAARLAALGVATAAEIEQLSTDADFVRAQRVPADSLEGYLYPATYRFTEFPDAAAALSRMVETFWKKLPSSYEQDVADRGLTLHEAVTFASLIELETYHDSERFQVSEVIWNRLNRKIALAIDAAIIYGISDYAGDLKRVHLEDAANPYNTRKHRGLPPGPIGSPSRQSLKAVLNPSGDGYLYYVLDLESGLHNFSRTLREHNSYVQKLLRDRRRIRAAGGSR